MNTGLYKNLEKDLEGAISLCNQEFSHEDILEMLKNGDVAQKQIAALKINSINSLEDAYALVNNLTGCDGKIREAVSYRIFKFLSNSPDTATFFQQTSPNIFADATIDINANICRYVIDSVNILKNDKSFIKKYSKTILSFAEQALDELDKFIFRDKKYVINKQLFKLYWCLEAIKLFYNDANCDRILKILQRSSEQKEYTVREKAAEIAILSDKFVTIKNTLKKDENYYVKAVFLNH